jgi:hypothetical protein
MMVGEGCGGEERREGGWFWCEIGLVLLALRSRVPAWRLGWSIRHKIELADGDLEVRIVERQDGKRGEYYCGRATGVQWLINVHVHTYIHT